MDARTLIKMWPTRSQLADATGVAVGVVHQWHNRNSIPAHHHVSIIRAAEAKGLSIGAMDLAEMAKDRARSKANIQNVHRQSSDNAKHHATIGRVNP